MGLYDSLEQVSVSSQCHVGFETKQKLTYKKWNLWSRHWTNEQDPHAWYYSIPACMSCNVVGESSRLSCYCCCCCCGGEWSGWNGRRFDGEVGNYVWQTGSPPCKWLLMVATSLLLLHTGNGWSMGNHQPPIFPPVIHYTYVPNDSASNQLFLLWNFLISNKKKKGFLIDPCIHIFLNIGFSCIRIKNKDVY